MGRTLLGIDLDESPVGGLVEGLLSEEELEVLTDGGPPDGRDERDEDAEAGTDPDADPDRSDRDAPGDVEDDDSAGETLSGSDVTFNEASDADEPVAGASGAGQTAGASGPAAETGSTGAGDRVPPVGPGAGTVDTSGESETDGRLERLRPLLLKAAVALAVLAAVAVVLWRYGGRIRAALPGPLGGEAGESGAGATAGPSEAAEPTAGEDVPPARRRAKAGATAERDEAAEEGRAAPATAETEAGGGGSPGEDVDLGALVGLGLLALIAALVRKFGEEPPRDSLVEGPDE